MSDEPTIRFTKNVCRGLLTLQDVCPVNVPSLSEKEVANLQLAISWIEQEARRMIPDELEPADAN